MPRPTSRSRLSRFEKHEKRKRNVRENPRPDTNGSRLPQKGKSSILEDCGRKVAFCIGWRMLLPCRRPIGRIYAGSLNAISRDALMDVQALRSSGFKDGRLDGDPASSPDGPPSICRCQQLDVIEEAHCCRLRPRKSMKKTGLSSLFCRSWCPIDQHRPRRALGRLKGHGPHSGPIGGGQDVRSITEFGNIWATRTPSAQVAALFE